MPRPQRCRRIGRYPDHWRFSAEDNDPEETVVLSLDEFEAIRLMDREGMTQEQCAQQMGVARTTVTAIYDSARKKLARFLTDGLTLQIAGGSYSLADDENKMKIQQKGIDQMRIAVTYENGEIFQHFGHTAQFKIYDVQEGKIVSSQVVDASGSGHGALAGFLKSGQVDALICGGIGMGARNALAEAGIKLYPGCSGNADEAAAALAAGTLSFDPDSHCDHHGNGEGQEGHCGHHGHGEGREGHCGHHGHGEGQEGHCGHHGHGEGQEGHCGHHGHGEGGHCGRRGDK